MKIKFKILSGFILIIMMLVIAGIVSIYEFSRLSKSVTALIDDNYKTIEASKTMLEALEREDSGILLLLSGHWKKGREILDSADSLFLAAFNIAKNNITETNEDKYIEQIDQSYLRFKERWEPPIVGTAKENSIDWYFTDLHNYFLAAKNDVRALMILNQESMYQESTKLKEKARRAIMPGIVAIIASLVFLVMFNFFISRYYVKPIVDIIQSLKRHTSQTQSFEAGIVTKDEFKELEKEIQSLIYRFKKTY
ncbi:MAG: hypothetical protein KKG99_12210 [Bacteroidetes bacterium]|nr:hypothetical protein [Bacteroidota bacterium]